MPSPIKNPPKTAIKTLSSVTVGIFTKYIRAAMIKIAISDRMINVFPIFRYPIIKNGRLKATRRTLMWISNTLLINIEIAVTPPSRKLFGIIKPLSATTAIKSPNTV
jgi:hypothetical protein